MTVLSIIAVVTVHDDCAARVISAVTTKACVDDNSSPLRLIEYAWRGMSIHERDAEYVLSKFQSTLSIVRAFDHQFMPRCVSAIDESREV